MQRLPCAAVVALFLWNWVLPTPVWSQISPYRPAGTPIYTPPVSPYLGLLGGGNPALNYYNTVRPLQDFANSINRLGAAQATTGRQSLLGQGYGIPTTGHPIYFQNYRQYFLTTQGVRAAGFAPYTPGAGGGVGYGGTGAAPYGGTYGTPTAPTASSFYGTPVAPVAPGAYRGY
jgi:hypothetical protein